MATIRTAIELQDNFTGVLYQVINSVNLGLSAMEDLHQTMNSPVDTASIEAARDSINQATLAVQQLDAAMQGLETPASETPTAPTNSAPVVLPVQPDIPDPLVDQPAPVDLPVEPEQPEPVQVPVHWRSDNMEVFTSTGVERFEQEVQSANNMLNTLNQTQSRIAAQAAQTDLFPDNAIADMNNMQNRLQAIQQRIQTIESNPLNMGSDTANAELEQLRGQLDQAVQEQEALNRAVENMDVEAANQAYLRLSQTVGNTERYIRDNVDEQGRFNREIEEGTNEADSLMQTIKGAVAAYATIQTLSTALNLSDQLTSTTARLNLMNDGLQTTQDLQNMIYLSAERARGSYQATADAVSKLGLMAGDAFGSSEEIIAFMEQVNKQFTIAGTEAAGIDAAMLQLTQAMGSGVLRGEEYNSILEQAPNIIQAIADYMEVPKGQLKDMAAEGQITADIVKAAMFAAADDTNAKFESMPKTFSQIWTSFQNTALMAFQPVLQRMNEIANSEAFQEFVNNAIEGLSMVAGIALEIFDLLVGVAGAVADNWSWLSPIIYGVAAALAVYYGWLLLTKGAEMAMAAVHGIVAVAKGIMAAATMLVTGATWAETTAQYGLNAAMYACPIVWIIILIIALIALFYAAVAAVNKFAGTSVSATGIICGAFMVALAFIGNIFVALWNLVVDVFVLIYNLVATVANFIGNVFTDPIGAVCRLFFDLADTVLGILQALASAIDAIFGSNLAGSVQGWRDSLGGWVDDTFGKGEEVMAKMNADDMKLGRFEYGAAWDAGYSFGEGIDESIANFDPSSLFNTNVPGADDYANLGNYGSGIGGIGSGVDDIAGNTGKIADSMDITEEDLKYLRDIAEQEAVNRFTTAEITIEQTNHNTVSGKMDLDGIVSGLTDAANEAVDRIAEGVHE
ncbi:tape measure protein [Enterocloster asparagiformis]|jgi:tape measure domain-containing protein|uniref:Tape measure domain protein n=1 Tax=[Clostridium] asparagiforme DSM 15981 TaxID=518636 RepID=C0DAH7_9FIRM|nr:tape measure protein [Enterocloster asparagiformis]EEG51693.1 tape measure domain protein [[Clostridium] asparagiforme DSM 15981]UWO76129.1 tape measure protein [[Clostridium] asparagiforme DSM 15981]DAX18104.1 MAG TPA: Tail tape measure [Caudoviricetes sp.]